MKKMNKIFIAIAALALIFTSCTGEDGRDGRDGFDGLDSEPTVIYEIGGLTFNEGNDYVINEAIPDDIAIDDSDIINVYRLLAIDDNVGEIWEQLPQLYFLDEGVLQYNFSFSQDDLDFNIDADFDLDTFDNPDFTDDQVFRIAVISASVSANTISAKSLNSSSSYEQVSKDAVVIKVKL